MPRAILAYIRWVEAVNYRIGRIVMYGIFVLVGILLWSSISKTFFLPSLWTLEMAQFAMVAYYILGGPYSIQLGSNVRMDLLYGGWSDRQKAWVDAFSVFFLMFFLCVLLYGGLSSSAYSLGYYGSNPIGFFADLVFGFMWDLVTGGYTAAVQAADGKMGTLERNPTAWRPMIWPIKLIMVIGIFLMLLQAIAEFFKDIARIRGVEI